MGIQSKIERLKTEVCRTNLSARLGLSNSDYTRFVILGMGRTGSNLLATPLRKQASKSAWEIIANYEELAQRFAGTPWADFFRRSEAERR